MHDYGKCHVCGERMKARRITQDFWIKGRLVVIEGMPAAVCQQCGGKVVDAEVGWRLVQLIKALQRRRKVRTISVPVIKFSREIT